jgi:putative spermidine/putrescine transport system ATP-binding protein/spermidine/putrescine transport system ATP-binding protein
MSDVRLAGVAKRFAQTWAVRDATFYAPAGSFLSLLGPSGCGKTTTLRLIGGFETPDHGDIAIAGSRINETPPWRRGLGVVFQNYALFPFMTSFDNVAFGLRRRRVPSDEVEQRVRAALALVGLPELIERYPAELSGGQQQRVALARALVIEPRVLLLDEPLSNLDAKLRAEMRFELKRIQRQAGLTTIFVTHDQEEALTLSDQIVVMSDGRVVASGAPREIWQRPGSRLVADFLGVENLLSATASGADSVRIDKCGAELMLTPDSAVAPGDKLVVGIRSHEIAIAGASEGSAPNVVPGTVGETNYRGANIVYQIATPLSDRPLVISTILDLTLGERVHLRLPPDCLMRLAPDPPVTS